MTVTLKDIARQVNRVLSERGESAAADRIGRHRFMTSDDRAAFQTVLRQLVQIDADVEAVRWRDDHTVERASWPTTTN